MLVRSRPVALGVSAVALWSTVSVVRQAEATRLGWGERRVVVRATRDLAPGTRLRANDLTMVELPKSAVVHGTTTTIKALLGRRVVSFVHAGDVIIAPRTRRVLSPVAARIAPGNRGVAIPTDQRLPALGVGDLVSIVDPTQPSMGAINGAVIDINDESVTVDATAEDAVVIANAVLRDSVAIFLRGPD